MGKLKSAAPKAKRGPLNLLGDGLLLFLALFGAVFSFSSAFSLQAYPLPLLIGCAVGTLGALAVFSLPKYRFIPLLALAGIWALVLAQLWDTLVLGEISLRCSVVNTFALSLGTGNMIQPIAQLPEETWSFACTVLVLAALPPLAAVLGLAVVRLRSFGLTLLFTLPFPALPSIIIITPDWLSLMALLACWGTLLLSSLAARRGGQAYARLNLICLPAVCLVLAVLTFAMPQENYQRPAWADHAYESITNWAVHASDQFFPDVKLAGGGLAGANGQVDLTDAGPLRFSGRTVLEVRTSLEGRIYLRGFSGAVYDGTSWYALSEEDYAQLNGPADVLTGSLFQPMNFPALADRNSFPNKEYTQVTIQNLGAGPGYVYYPYHILSTPDELSGAQFVHDSYLAQEANVWTHTLYIQPQCSPLSGAELTSAAARTENSYRNFVHQFYTSLDGIPEDTLAALNDAFLEISAHPDRCLPDGWDNEHYRAIAEYAYNGSQTGIDYHEHLLHMAGLFAGYLDQLAEYDPNTPATPEGEDFVAYFMTESHRGYCMHFASAAVLMLRLMGIPARYVAGYVADVPASGRCLVPDSNAHAWVEVYLDGYGWEPVEVTPVYAGAQPGLSGTPAESETPEPTPTTAPTPSRAPSAAAPTPTPTPTPPPASGAGNGPRLDPRLLLIPAAVLIVLAVLVLRRWLALRRRNKRFMGGDTNRAAIQVYLYLQRLTRWGGSISEAAEELAKKAKFSQHTLTESERTFLTDEAQAQANQIDQGLPLWKRLLFRYILGLY